MSLDNYLFIDREKACVYVRSSSCVYGGFSRESLHGEEPDYVATNYKDAVRWASKYEPIEYGIYTGTLCPECEREVEDKTYQYPLCRWCHLFRETEKEFSGKQKTSLQRLLEEVRPYLP